MAARQRWIGCNTFRDFCIDLGDMPVDLVQTMFMLPLEKRDREIFAWFWTAILSRTKLSRALISSASFACCGVIAGRTGGCSVAAMRARIVASILSVLGSGLIDHSQKMTVAARAMAEKKTVGHRS